jgi:hypothetical protein
VKLIIIVFFKELLFPTFKGLIMYVVAEDIEAGIRTKTKFQTEPTLPIYLKVINNIYTHFICHKVLSFFSKYSCT